MFLQLKSAPPLVRKCSPPSHCHTSHRWVLWKQTRMQFGVQAIIVTYSLQDREISLSWRQVRVWSLCCCHMTESHTQLDADTLGEDTHTRRNRGLRGRSRTAAGMECCSQTLSPWLFPKEPASRVSSHTSARYHLLQGKLIKVFLKFQPGTHKQTFL